MTIFQIPFLLLTSALWRYQRITCKRFLTLHIYPTLFSLPQCNLLSNLFSRYFFFLKKRIKKSYLMIINPIWIFSWLTDFHLFSIIFYDPGANRPGVLSMFRISLRSNHSLVINWVLVVNWIKNQFIDCNYKFLVREFT